MWWYDIASVSGSSQFSTRSKCSFQHLSLPSSFEIVFPCRSFTGKSVDWKHLFVCDFVSLYRVHMSCFEAAVSASSIFAMYLFLSALVLLLTSLSIRLHHLCLQSVRSSGEDLSFLLFSIFSFPPCIRCNPFFFLLPPWTQYFLSCLRQDLVELIQVHFLLV